MGSYMWSPPRNTTLMRTPSPGSDVTTPESGGTVVPSRTIESIDRSDATTTPNL